MSNKTPKEQPSETASALKSSSNKYLKLILAFIAVVIFIRVFLIIYYQSVNTNILHAPKGNINLEIVDTPELRQLGLSGRSSISDGDGMLFVFENSSTNNCFWMKDMKFSIDMVWMNENREVVTIIPDVSPETYPETFCPEQPAKYVLEVGSGRAAELGILPDVELKF